MDINQKDRDQLKSSFVTGAVPTEQNYAELIDGMLNQKDDGLVKQAGHPLCLEAAGDDASAKPALQLYDSFLDDQPAWTLRLNPHADPDDPATARSGLSVHDAAGASRLFIESGSGDVGIGTIEPRARLHVAGTGEFNDLLTARRLRVVEPGEWIAPEYARGWRRYSQGWEAPGYMKDSLGRVRLRGMIAGPASQNAVMFTLPEGHRPAVARLFTAITHPDVIGRINVYADGTVRVFRGSGVWISLESVHFQAGQ